MSAPFAPGDVVVAVYEDVCPVHMGDPHYDTTMIGQHFRIRDIEIVGACVGYVDIGDGNGCDWCAGTFRKVDDEVTEDFRERLKSLSTPKERVGA